MAIRRAISTQDEQFDPYGAQVMGIAAGEPAPSSYTPNVGQSDPPTPAPTPPNPVPGVPRASYDPMAGWDVSKLNDPNAGTSDKYLFGRFLQDQGYGAAGSRGRLNDIAAAFNQQYGKNIKATGDDRIDFGGNTGPIDVINSNGTWQWLVPGDGQQGGSGSGAASPFGALFAALSQGASNLAGQTPTASALMGDWTTAAQGPTRNASSTASAIEAARMPYEIARKSQLANSRAALADRGLLSEPGHAQGPEATTINNIETNLAPAYTQAINDRLQQLDALGLAQLEQNRLWNQFIADFGLNRDRVLYDMQHGNTDQYLQMLQLWLNAAGTAANGYI